jgi:regulator of replication initiation timing
MHLQNEFKTLYNEIELLKRDQHYIVGEGKLLTLKNEILDILKTLFGETSREYRVVKLTNSPATMFKVMNHIASRTETLISIKTAVNM